MSEIDGYEIKGQRGSWFVTVSRHGNATARVPVVWEDCYDGPTKTYVFQLPTDETLSEINWVRRINVEGKARGRILIVVARAKDATKRTRERQEYRRVLSAEWQPVDDEERQYRFKVVGKA